MNPLWSGLLCGALVAGGLLLIWQGLPMRRQPTLADRIAPYVLTSPRPSHLLVGGTDELSVNAVLAPVLRRAGALVDHWLGGSTSVRRRLARAGQPDDLDGFRAQQAMWGLVGAIAAAGYVTLQLVGGGTSLTDIALVPLAAAGGVILRDQALTRAADARERAILGEFPAIAEMLALAITAGEGAAAALERIANLSSGHLSAELQRCLVDARAGATLPEALQGLSDRTGLPGLARFVDGIVVALERGTPLADVMRAQAQDARDASKQQLIESGGRREIYMMIPVVFLVLPVTIAFALRPLSGSGKILGRRGQFVRAVRAAVDQVGYLGSGLTGAA